MAESLSLNLRERADDPTVAEVADLFGDTMTQDDLQEFLSIYASSEESTEVQGSLVSVTLSIAFSC